MEGSNYRQTVPYFDNPLRVAHTIHHEFAIFVQPENDVRRLREYMSIMRGGIDSQKDNEFLTLYWNRFQCGRSI
jgi:hypothetical protein